MTVVAEEQRNERSGRSGRPWVIVGALVPALLLGVSLVRPVLVPLGERTFGLWTTPPYHVPHRRFTLAGDGQGSWIAIVRVGEDRTYSIAWLPSKHLLGD
jgi:hypothetical protein